MTKVKDLHQKWMKSAEYRKAYEALTPEFELARAVIDARVTAGLTQEQLANPGNSPMRPERAVRQTPGTSRGGPAAGAG